MREAKIRNNQENEELGSRKIAFSRDLYIERNDFVLEKPNKHYKRLALGLEVRLFHAYFVKANEVRYDENGEICEVLCTYDKQTLSGTGFNERKPNGTIGFVEASTAKKAQFNLFEPLLLDSEAKSENFLDNINEKSWEKLNGYIENGDYNAGDAFQLIRDGYYCVDKTSTEDLVVFNRTVSLKSSFK